MVVEWGERVCVNPGKAHMRPMPREACKKRFKTPWGPNDFYLVSGFPTPVIARCPSVPSGEDYSPLRGAYRPEQVDVMVELSLFHVVIETDLEGSGLESSTRPYRAVNQEFHISDLNWRCTFVPNNAVLEYMGACRAPFSPGEIPVATTLGGRLVLEYRKYTHC